MPECPDPDLLAALGEGRLDESARRPLEQHMDRCPGCRSTLAVFVRATSDGDAAWALGDDTAETRSLREDSARATALPARIGAYRITGLLGAGGMGVVYRARLDDDSPEIALKCVLAADYDERARRRFAAEARVARGLDHPNVVRVLDSGETDRGILYLVMELLTGEDLSRRLRRGVLDPLTAARLVAGAAEGVAAAHAMGVAHRDIKPANLFCCHDARLKVLDFGLAVPFGKAVVRSTRRGQLKGTPAFMAPEQVSGGGEEDARTDVWGLGATLHCALAGRPPFYASSTTAQLLRIAAEPPDPLPASVPEWLAELVRQCLAKDPADRPASAEDLAGALRSGSAGGRSFRTTAAAAPLSDEIRLVAILLAQHVGDPETFATAVRRRGGLLSWLPEGAALGVFGGDVAFGDEPLRAVRAGLDVRAGGVTGGLAVSMGHALRGRAGAIVDQLVERARGVLSAEGVGVDEEVRALAEGRFDSIASCVLGDREAVAPPSARASAGEGTDGTFHGRARERQQLAQTMGQALQERRAAGALVIGPAGIGKSHLVQRALADLCAGPPPRPLCLLARGQHTGTPEPWHALAMAMRAVLEEPGAVSPLREGPGGLGLGAAALALGGVLAVDRGSALGDVDPSVAFDARVDAFGDWLEALTARGPVVLVLEDADRVDRASLRATGILLRRLADRPLFVLGTARDGLEGRLADLPRMVLQPLTNEEGRAILESIVGAAHPWIGALLERAAGSPLFAVELALAARRGSPHVPASLEAAVRSRLDSLPRAEKNLLRRAAICGVHFWVEALEAAGQSDPAPLLESLRRRGLVSPDAASRLAGIRQWSFCQELVRDVAAGTLTEPQRRALHEAFGRWLSERRDAPASEIAHHLEHGLDGTTAAPYWDAAADAARRHGDQRVAEEATSRSRLVRRGGARP